MGGAISIALALAEIAAKAVPVGLKLWQAITEARDVIGLAQKEGRDLTAEETNALLNKLLMPGDELEQLGRAAASEAP